MNKLEVRPFKEIDSQRLAFIKHLVSDVLFNLVRLSDEKDVDVLKERNRLYKCENTLKQEIGIRTNNLKHNNLQWKS